jgi:DNA-binding transcriptional MerR regulator
MQKFTIRDIEHMCGIKAHTLRIWEQRYDLFTPKRKESQHRNYDNDDLKKLLRISLLYHSGWKISKIANLSLAQINELVLHIKTGSENFSGSILKLIEAAVLFDEKEFNNMLDHLISIIGLEKTIIQVCYPFLNRIGLLWITNNIIPAQEHFSSYLIQHKIIAATDRLPVVNHEANQIVLFTPKGEHHEMPLLFIHYLFKKQGWKTIYMGSDMELKNIEEVAGSMNFQYLFLYMITNFTRFDIDDYFESVCKAFPGKKIIATGKSVQSAQRNFINLTILKSDEEIFDFINKDFQHHTGST